MESCELKTATKANQHHSLFAKSSKSSCLIQTTLVFITHTCCTRDTEPTAAHNKHSCCNTIPLSIYITTLLVSMQIKLIPHRIGDLTGTVWNEATVSRPDGRRGAIIRTGCGAMTSSATAAPSTAGLTITCHSCFLESFPLLPSLTLLSTPWSASLIHSTWADSKEEEDTSCVLGTCVVFFNDTVTHAEPCINADCDSWRLVGSSGLTVHSHVKEVMLKTRDAQQWGKEEEEENLSAVWRPMWPANVAPLLYKFAIIFGHILSWKTAANAFLLFYQLLSFWFPV